MTAWPEIVTRSAPGAPTALGHGCHPSRVETSAEPAGFVVAADGGERIHFLDWGGAGSPAVVLVHGLANTAWAWAPVARRLVEAGRRVVAMDLRGHGLSDAPTDDGAYGADVLADDVAAVAEGSGALGGGPLVVAGHGFGAIVAAWAAARLGSHCSALVLVDGGLADLGEETGMEPDEFLRGLDEPPEVLASLDAFLADRRAWDPATWDGDQDRAARATVVETAAGRVVPATRPHALRASVETMFGYRPAAALAAVGAPIRAIVREAPAPPAAAVLPATVAIRVVPAVGHNLMRYRPDEVTATILGR